MKMLQIRNVPDELHRALKARAARDGITMSDLVLQELPRLAHAPAPEDVLARIRRREPVAGMPSADLVAGDRDRR